jgi:hypothetical protein
MNTYIFLIYRYKYNVKQIKYYIITNFTYAIINELGKEGTYNEVRKI